MESSQKNLFISVDVETAGPSPSEYSLLSIGACMVFDPSIRFYVELQPVSDAYTSEAMQITGMDLAKLKVDGLPPHQAMEKFADWIASNIPAGEEPVFVAFNAPFDWMFITVYFHRHLGHNPFGHKALDIKAYYMGMDNTAWNRTSFEIVSQQYGFNGGLPHNALGDAVIQANIFRAMLAKQEEREERNAP